MSVFHSINPATGAIIEAYRHHDEGEVEEALQRAWLAWRGWRMRPIEERAAVVARAGEILEERAEALARLMALEMGKPLSQGIGEAKKSAWVCRYYAEHGAEFLRPELIATESRESFVAYRPLGPVLAVMPWNFPLWQVFRFAAPGLVAGNVGLLKHASNVPGCALAIEEIFGAAGGPEGVFQALLIPGARVGSVIADRRVAAVTLTGSTPAGRSVAAAAGQALKKCVLELGGSDPYLILDDADLEGAVAACAQSRLINSGQSCIAAKRFIVVASRQAAFEQGLVSAMAAARMGDPLEAETTLGPQARVDLRDELHAQVQRSIAAGARLLLGGEIPAGPGAYYPATVLSDVRPGMAAFDEELFGPVAAIISARDAAHAIELANQSEFGLGAAVFTGDLARGKRLVVEEIEAGCCAINDFVRSDPRLPFGGIKTSGFGRELGREGIREFVNHKTVVVA